MYNHIALINTIEHKNSAVKRSDSLSYAKELISAPITASEFYECCKDYPKGKPTQFTNSVLEFMNRFQFDALATTHFISQLDKWELLEEKTAQIITPDQKNYQLNGFYVVNEEKLQHLSKKKKQEICDQNAYPLITAHLISLSNVQRLGIR